MHCSVGILALAIVCLAFGAPAAIAAEDSLLRILEQQAELKRQLDAGELAQLTPRQTNAIRKAQAEVTELTHGASTLDDLDIQRKVRLENALERINANFVGSRAAQGDKQVCKRVPVTGSAMKTTRCAPQAEWDQLREASRSSLEKTRVCVPPGCGG